MNWIQINGALELGLIFGLCAMAVYLTFRVINFPDLTIDGSFTLGAAVSGTLINSGLDPILSSLSAMLAGSACGFVTGMLHCKARMMELLAGILTMIGLYSINIRIMDRPNITIKDELTIYNYLANTFPPLLTNLLIVLLVTICLWLLLRSQFGLALRATGINPKLCKSYGIDITVTKISAIMLSNAIIALAGSLFATSNGFADISMGTGTIIIALASIIIGESLFKTRSLITLLIACSVGAIIYRLTIMFALGGMIPGLKSSDLNLVTSLLIILIMVVPKIRTWSVSHD